MAEKKPIVHHLPSVQNADAPALEADDYPEIKAFGSSPDTIRMLIDYYHGQGDEESADRLAKLLPLNERAAFTDDRSRESYRNHFYEAGVWAGILGVGGVVKALTGIESVFLAIPLFIGCLVASLTWWGERSIVLAIGRGFQAVAVVLGALGIFVVGVFGVLLLAMSC